MGTESSGNRVLVKVIKEFTEAPEKVFDAWLNTDMLSEWMVGPKVRDEKIVKLESQPHKDGIFSFVVLRDNQILNHFGTYLEFNRPNRLVFTWKIESESEDESVVTIDIVAIKNGCRLSLTHELIPKWSEYADRTEAEWSFMLDKLSNVLS